MSVCARWDVFVTTRPYQMHHVPWRQQNQHLHLWPWQERPALPLWQGWLSQAPRPFLLYSCHQYDRRPAFVVLRQGLGNHHGSISQSLLMRLLTLCIASNGGYGCIHPVNDLIKLSFFIFIEGLKRQARNTSRQPAAFYPIFY